MAGLNDELAALVRDARYHDVGPSVAAQDRAWARIQQRLVVGPPPIPVERFVLSSSAGGGKLILVLAIVTWIGAALLGGVAAAVVLDSDAGAPRIAEREPEPEPSADTMIATWQPTSTTLEDPIVLFDDSGQDPDVEVEIVDVARSRNVARVSTRGSDDLAAETRLLRGAQARLREGDVAAAAELLRMHARQFPSGLLADLRTALEIDAQCRRGEHDGARALARSFAQRYPNSPYRARARGCDETRFVP